MHQDSDHDRDHHCYFTKILNESRMLECITEITSNYAEIAMTSRE